MIGIQVGLRSVSKEHAIHFCSWCQGGAERTRGTASSSTANKTRKQVDILQEENNMLKLKVEVLLNLVAETIAEFSNTEK